MPRVIWRREALFWIAGVALAISIGILLERGVSVESVLLAIGFLPIGGLAGYLVWGYWENIPKVDPPEHPEPLAGLGFGWSPAWIFALIGASVIPIGVVITGNLSADWILTAVISIPVLGFAGLIVWNYLAKLRTR